MQINKLIKIWHKKDPISSISWVPRILDHKTDVCKFDTSKRGISSPS
jgi:hypothetical protein